MRSITVSSSSVFTPPTQKMLAGVIREYLGENRLMTLATCDKKGRPWASTVFFAFDKKFHFYFLSEYTTRHAENIHAIGRAAAAINQKSMPPGKIVGAQFEGRASMVQGKSLVHAYHIMRLRYPWASRYLPRPRYEAGNANRIFCITPGRIFYIDDTRFPAAMRMELLLR